jgi:hypothetical protein
LFASCGLYRDTDTGELGWGSPLLALRAIDPFDVYLFGEKDPERAKVLAGRVDDSGLVRYVTCLSLERPGGSDARRRAVQGRRGSPDRSARSSPATRTSPSRS